MTAIGLQIGLRPPTSTGGVTVHNYISHATYLQTPDATNISTPLITPLLISKFDIESIALVSTNASRETSSRR